MQARVFRSHANPKASLDRLDDQPVAYRGGGGGLMRDLGACSNWPVGSPCNFGHSHLLSSSARLSSVSPFTQVGHSIYLSRTDVVLNCAKDSILPVGLISHLIRRDSLLSFLLNLRSFLVVWHSFVLHSLIYLQVCHHEAVYKIHLGLPCSGGRFGTMCHRPRRLTGCRACERG